jgi:hypothetical protein
MIIERFEEIRKLNETRKWVLVYGRRKTGKTFLVENFVDYGEYFFIKRDRGIISKKDNKTINYETFIEILKRALEDNKIAVVDEFHRLGDDFFDFLHYTKKQGKLILITSTLFLSKKLFSSRSALLGFFAELPVGLISTEDCIKALGRFKFDKKQLVELAILLREPIAIDYFNEKKDARKIFNEILIGSVKTIPALLGEIFTEEERSITAIYEGVLRAVASGKVISSEISSYLFSKKLIGKDDPSMIQQYLDNLVKLGIIKKISIFGKKRFIYKHVSVLAKLFYYTDEKYNISERKLDEKETGRIIDEVMPKIVEDNIRELFANKFGLKETIVEAKDYDVDAYLLKFNKPEMAIEVKWKKNITEEDIAKAEKNLYQVNANKKLLFVPNKRNLQSEILEIVDISDFITKK